MRAASTHYLITSVNSQDNYFSSYSDLDLSGAGSSVDDSNVMGHFFGANLQSPTEPGRHAHDLNNPFDDSFGSLDGALEKLGDDVAGEVEAEAEANIFAACGEVFADEEDYVDSGSPVMSYDNSLEYFSDEDGDVDDYFEGMELGFGKSVQQAILESIQQGENALATSTSGLLQNDLLLSRSMSSCSPAEIFSQMKYTLGIKSQPTLIDLTHTYMHVYF